MPATNANAEQRSRRTRGQRKVSDALRKWRSRRPRPGASQSRSPSCRPRSAASSPAALLGSAIPLRPGQKSGSAQRASCPSQSICNARCKKAERVSLSHSLFLTDGAAHGLKPIVTCREPDALSADSKGYSGLVPRSAAYLDGRRNRRLNLNHLGTGSNSLGRTIARMIPPWIELSSASKRATRS